MTPAGTNIAAFGSPFLMMEASARSVSRANNNRIKHITGAKISFMKFTKYGISGSCEESALNRGPLPDGAGSRFFSQRQSTCPIGSYIPHLGEGADQAGFVRPGNFIDLLLADAI